VAIVSGFIVIDNYGQRSSGVMIRGGAYSLLWFYFMAAAAVSMGFLTGFSDSVKWLVTIQLVIMAFAAVIMVPLIASSKSVYEKKRLTLQSAAMLKQLGDLVMLLKSDAKNDKYSLRLEKVYDAIKYCDNSSYVPSDDLIAVRINELEEILGTESGDKDERVRAKTDEILLLTRKRAAEVSNLKKGVI